MDRSKLLSKFTILFIFLVVTAVSSNLHWHGDSWQGVIESDGKGYYAYLPAVFIHDDLNFGYFDSLEGGKYYQEHLFYDYRILQNGKYVDKYFAGTAICMMPFFFAGHISSYLFNHPPDGFSKMYHLAISFAGIFYLIFGCVFLSKVLRSYQIEEGVISLMLLAIVFGTNVFYYTVGEPAMSHIYSFALIAAFVYYGQLFFERFRTSHLLILAGLLGLIILVRPVNGLVLLLLPFIAASHSKFKAGFNEVVQYKFRLLVSFCIVLAIISIQPIIYYIQTGYFWIYSYGNEGFNFFDPQVFNILFSYKKGLFLYTPLALLSLVGMVVLYRRSRFEFYSLSSFLIVLTYLLSSWWSWWYGGSFSSRVYMDYFVLLAILLGTSYKLLKTNLSKYVYSALILLFIVVCQIQTFQYRYYFIHWEDMDKQKYWDVFMRIDLL